MKTLFEGKKLYAVIIAFLLISTFFITFQIIGTHYQHVVKDTIATNTLTANLLSTLIYEHQKAATSILESYARRQLFIDAAKKKDFHRAVYHLKSLSEHYTEIDALFITDQYGTLWADYRGGRESYGRNFVYRDWYKGVSKNWRPYISTLYRRIVLEKGLAVAIAVPIFDRKGKVIGILGGAQRTPFLATFIKANTLNPKKSITLLDQEGNIIFSNTIPYEEKITKYPDAHVLEKALAGVFIDMEIADAKEKGSIFYVSIAPVRGIGWSVIVGQEKNTILKQLYWYFIRSAATGFVIFLFLTVCLFYFRREYEYRKTKELLQAEEKYRNIFNDAILGIYQTTPEGRFLSANPALARMEGYDTPEELINSVTDIATQSYINPEDREIFKRSFSREGVVEKFETRLRKKGGEIIWISINAHIAKDTQGNISSYEGTIEDITERKQAEEMLHESEENFRTVVENASDAILVGAGEGSHVYANQKAAEITGYCVAELLKTTIKDLAHPDELEKIMQIYRRRLEGEPVTRWYETTIIRKDGKSVPIEVAGTKTVWQGKTADMVFFHDITERKQAEEALRLSEENFRRSLDDSPLGVRIVTMKGETLYANRAILGIYGYDSIEELRTMPLKERYTPESYAEFQIRKEKRQRGEYDPFEYEVSIVRKNGEVRNLQVFRKEILWNGERQFQTIYQDITERKQAEIALIESENKFKGLVEGSIAGVYIIQDGIFKYVNQLFAEIHGYTVEEMVDKLGPKETILPDDLPMVEENIRKRLLGKTVTEYFTFRVVRKDKKVVHIEVYGSSMMYQGKPAIIGTLIDITFRKQAEEALQQSEEKYRVLIDTTDTGYLILDAQGRVIDANKEYIRLTGYGALEEILGRGVVEWTAPYDLERNAAEVKRCVEQGYVRNLEIDYVNRSGQITPIELNATVMGSGDSARILSLCRDITDRRRTEKALRENEERYRILAEKTITGIYLVQDGLFKYVNPEFCKIFKYTQDEIVDKFGPLDFVVEEEKGFLKDKIQERLSGEKESDQFSIRIRRKDGEIRFLEIFGSYTLYARKPAVLGTCIDMTEIRKANEAIKKSQEELRALTAYLQKVREEERIRIAREMHDELGQSLTGIKIDISWLKKNLADTVKPTDPIKAKIDSLLGLTDSVIARTRELSLSLRPGILDDLGLVAAISWEIKQFQEKTGIICTFQSDVAEITIPEEYTTALFRIYQECLTNIIRYAHATEVKITLMEKGGNLVLEIEDNGKGITTEQLRSPISLGILGMRERIVSLKGTFSISGAPGRGTKVRVKVPVK